MDRSHERRGKPQFLECQICPLREVQEDHDDCIHWCLHHQHSKHERVMRRQGIHIWVANFVFANTANVPTNVGARERVEEDADHGGHDNRGVHVLVLARVSKRVVPKLVETDKVGNIPEMKVRNAILGLVLDLFVKTGKRCPVFEGNVVLQDTDESIHGSFDQLDTLGGQELFAVQVGVLVAAHVNKVGNDVAQDHRGTHQWPARTMVIGQKGCFEKCSNIVLNILHRVVDLFEHPFCVLIVAKIVKALDRVSTKEVVVLYVRSNSVASGVLDLLHGGKLEVAGNVLSIKGSRRASVEGIKVRLNRLIEVSVHVSKHFAHQGLSSSGGSVIDHIGDEFVEGVRVKVLLVDAGLSSAKIRVLRGGTKVNLGRDASVDLVGSQHNVASKVFKEDSSMAVSHDDAGHAEESFIIEGFLWTSRHQFVTDAVVFEGIHCVPEDVAPVVVEAIISKHEEGIVFAVSAVGSVSNNIRPKQSHFFAVVVYRSSKFTVLERAQDDFSFLVSTVDHGKIAHSR
mmetsp:Transcript_117396/g.175324  ORF Transcript_117396/g.175324 Transcript_117396/m.175324 type:complete len:513 (+) Transcript_117396:471-2009(+)